MVHMTGQTLKPYLDNDHHWGRDQHDVIDLVKSAPYERLVSPSSDTRRYDTRQGAAQSLLQGKAKVSFRDYGDALSRTAETERLVREALNPDMLYSNRGYVDRKFARHLKSDAKDTTISGYASGVSDPEAIAEASIRGDKSVIGRSRRYNEMIATDAEVFGVSKGEYSRRSIRHEIGHAFKWRARSIDSELGNEHDEAKAAAYELKQAQEAFTYAESSRLDIQRQFRNARDIALKRMKLVDFLYKGRYEIGVGDRAVDKAELESMLAQAQYARKESGQVAADQGFIESRIRAYRTEARKNGIITSAGEQNHIARRFKEEFGYDPRAEAKYGKSFQPSEAAEYRAKRRSDHKQTAQRRAAKRGKNQPRRKSQRRASRSKRSAKK